MKKIKQITLKEKNNDIKGRVHNNVKSLPDEEQLVIQRAELQGLKLGFYISALDITDEAKHALMNIALTMSLSQLQELSDILEARFLNYTTKWVDTGFQMELGSVNAQYNDKRDKAYKKLTDQIQSSSKELEQLIVKLGIKE